MKAMEFKNFIGEVKSANPDSLTVEHVVVSEKRDRTGDVMRVSGLQVEGIPTVLLEHGQGIMKGEPIGKVVSIKKGEFKGYPAVIGKTTFFDDEVGRRIYKKVTEGFAPNFSVGFIPLKWEYFQDDLGGKDIKVWSLLEWSVVGVPAQPLATTLDKNQPQICFKVMPSNNKNSRMVTVVRPGDKPPTTRTVHINDDVVRRAFGPGKIGSITISDSFVNDVVKRTVTGELNRLKGRVE